MSSLQMPEGGLELSRLPCFRNLQTLVTQGTHRAHKTQAVHTLGTHSIYILNSIFPTIAFRPTLFSHFLIQYVGLQVQTILCSRRPENGTVLCVRDVSAIKENGKWPPQHWRSGRLRCVNALGTVNPAQP